MTIKLCAASLVVLALFGCASKPVERVPDRVILLPSDTGKPSGVVVKTKDAEVALSTPYAVVEIRGSNLARAASTPEQIEQRYGRLLLAQAKTPKVFTVLFVLATDEFTPASKTAFEEARKEIASWSGPEVVVIGHTDRMGSDEFNDALSRKRAEMVAARLVASGVPAARISVVARGEREPLVSTADEVPEPRNRRVEIKVR
jgi:outer membrane protein OmpA-like peptidoglycan-associated protein